MKHPDPIVLPITVARCTQGKPCTPSGRCARAQVAHEMNRPAEDFTRHHDFSPRYGCGHYLSASAFRQAPAAPQPTVHDAPRGLA